MCKFLLLNNEIMITPETISKISSLQAAVNQAGLLEENLLPLPEDASEMDVNLALQGLNDIVEGFAVGSRNAVMGDHERRLQETSTALQAVLRGY